MLLMATKKVMVLRSSNDKDNVPTDAEYSGSGLIEAKVEGESEPSSENDRIDDSADDRDHEDHFSFDVEDENDGEASNAFGGGGFHGLLNQDGNSQAAGVNTVVHDVVVGEDVEVEKISESYETKDIDSYEGDSDDMIKKKRYPKYIETEMSRDYEYKVGLEFKLLTQFKDAIREHALLNGRDIRYIKNDKKIVTNISIGEEMKIATEVQTIQDKYMANISATKAYSVREKARDEVHGKAILQYSKLRDYCVEIMRTNPGSTTQILVDRPSITHQPSRWNWIFMSDQQKGLMQVSQEMMPSLEYRLCLRHLYANCKKAYGAGTILRDLILSIAKATYVEEWERRMTQLMHINQQCYKKNWQHWIQSSGARVTSLFLLRVIY
ncbi:hypothetical protein Ahy_A08g039672 [Arachis hypogaea]|uniref:Transposase MuDR plant domain-containing protein n=1 Tax=Arachis hypogaea TaxID=3818 RepID=A0A445BWZ7_ARAHY|nr:hypothetical protein Ahy_A08g039672 [Arachis hypogaea]